jgi:hypothetical protein
MANGTTKAQDKEYLKKKKELNERKAKQEKEIFKLGVLKESE